MAWLGWTEARHWTAQRFPERHIYLHSGDDQRVFVVSTRKQLAMAVAGVVLAGWCVVATGSVAALTFAQSGKDAALSKMSAYYERLNADRQGRLQAAVTALGRASGSVEGMARDIEKRHAALAWLLQDFHGKTAVEGVKPVDMASLVGRSPAEQMQAVREDQDRLLSQAESVARTRAERLRFAIRMTGLSPANLSRPDTAAGVGGPMIDQKDPRALAAELDVDESYAIRVQHAASDLLDYRSLSRQAELLPIARPVNAAVGTSTYGVRRDPFTGHPAFHAGQDFAGGYGSPVFSTAPGVVSFTGIRTGYGNVVEIDHGLGFKTRYAHLASVSVRPGQRVGVGFRVGALGSTGRSTGPHLHYEVWENGRVRDPTRFLKAGDHVQQAD